MVESTQRRREMLGVESNTLLFLTIGYFSISGLILLVGLGLAAATPPGYDGPSSKGVVIYIGGGVFWLPTLLFLAVFGFSWLVVCLFGQLRANHQTKTLVS